MFKNLPYILRYKSIFEKFGDQASSFFFVDFFAAGSGYADQGEPNHTEYYLAILNTYIELNY
jgi:hypothetical protein